MKTTSKPGTWAKYLGLLGIGLCGLCCALPFIGIVTGTGILAALSIQAENLALFMLMVSAALLVFWRHKKTKAPSCSVDCSCKNEETKTRVI